QQRIVTRNLAKSGSPVFGTVVFVSYSHRQFEAYLMDSPAFQRLIQEDRNTAVDSFNQPITITLSYTDPEIADLITRSISSRLSSGSESKLKIDTLCRATNKSSSFTISVYNEVN